MPNNSQIHAMIDVSSYPYGRGVSRYTSNLVEALASLPHTELTVLGYSLRASAELKEWSNQFGSSVHKRVFSVPPTAVHTAWEYLGVPKVEWIQSQADVFHAWDWHLAPIGTTPQVVTIHDLAYKLFPETAHPKVVARYDVLLQTLEQNPDIQIIAVSESTKRDILNFTSIPQEQVTVVYEAQPSEAQYVPAQEEIESVRQSLPGNKPFWLTVGTTEPRKNLQRVIAAWRKVKEAYDLYIVGAAGWDTLPQESGMYFLGYVEPKPLASYYRLAHALVYTSLYEGFGLPILEAYFHGCPVVTSQVSSMAEIAGPGALLVDPYNVDAIAEACQSIELPDSTARKRRIQQMQQTLNQFSWQQAAKETRAVYQKAVA